MADVINLCAPLRGGVRVASNEEQPGAWWLEFYYPETPCGPLWGRGAAQWSADYDTYETANAVAQRINTLHGLPRFPDIEHEETDSGRPAA